MLQSHKIKLLPPHTGVSSSFLSTLKCSTVSYYQVGLGNRLCYEIMFNDYNGVIKSAVSSPKVPYAKYEISNISLEYEIVTQPTLETSIKTEYDEMVLLYDRILIDNFQLICQIRLGIGHLIPLVNP